MADSKESCKRATTITKIVAGIGVSALVMKALFAKFPTKAQRRKRSLAKHETAFSVADSRANDLVKDFEEQLTNGLRKEHGSSLMMLPTWMTTLPTGDEMGEFYAIDVGGTNIRVMYCHLGNGKNQVISHDRREIDIPENRKRGKVQNLFDFIVGTFKTFLQLTGREVPGQKLKIGFCFSFPLRMEAPDVGYFTQMTKGFAFEDVKGRNVVQMLKDSFAAQKMDADIRMVCNDAVGVLAAGMYANANTEIGVVLGTGTNAACIEKIESIPKWRPGLPKDLPCAVNIEWGGFISEFLPWTPQDNVLDRDSGQAGEYLFEKMVSGDSMGELCRLILLSLCEEGALFKGGRVGDLKTPHCFTSEMVCEICSDRSRCFCASSASLKSSLHLLANAEDMKMIRRVCEMVVERAALLIGCAMAATLVHVHRAKPTSTDPIVVYVDGSAYVKFEKLRKDINMETKRVIQLVYGAQAPKFQLLPYLGGSCFGAAVLAAALYPEEADAMDPLQFPELEYLDH